MNSTELQVFNYTSSFVALDSYNSLISGVNRNLEALNKNRSYYTPRPSTQYLENKYRSNSLFAHIIDTWANESTKKGIEFDLESINKDENKKSSLELKLDNIQKAISDNKLTMWLNRALKTNNLQGACLLVFIFESDNTSTDLSAPISSYSDIKGIRQVLLFEKDYITNKELNSLGEYEKFTVNNGQISNVYHADRCIFFNGVYKTDRSLIDNNGFGESIITNTLDQSIDNYINRNNVLNELLAEYKIDVYYVDRLNQRLATKSKEQKDLIYNEIGTTAESKNLLGFMVVDSNNKVERLSLGSLTGAIDLIKQAESDLVIQSGIPATKLLGVNQTGMVTGKGNDSQLSDFYGKILQYQEYYLKHAYNFIIKLICAMFGYSDKVYNVALGYKFCSLFEQSELEDAQEDKLEAETELIKLETEQKKVLMVNGNTSVNTPNQMNNSSDNNKSNKVSDIKMNNKEDNNLDVGMTASE